jgi:hypothetical protein
LYPVRQVLVQAVLMGARPTFRGGALDDAIAMDHNEGTAAMEAATYLAAALAFAKLA